mgnify:CR=1 FL=1
MTPRCIELVKEFEGFRSKPYLCPAGYLTIGYGHVVTPQEKERLVKSITEEEALRLLVWDLIKVEWRLYPLIHVLIHPWMRDALVSFAFNVGIYAFRASTLRRKLNAGDFWDAADEFLRWVYAGGRRLKGLVRRREAERALFLEGLREM